MKPITNILLVLALICYVFLPLLDVQFGVSVTGLSFTSGTIARHFGLRSVAYALTPFVAYFTAIGLNTLRHRWWALGAAACILLGLWFLYDTAQLRNMPLTHLPEVSPGEDLGDGFEVLGLGVGHHITSALTLLAFCSALLSLLPWKFNSVIEHAVDETIDRGIEDVRALRTRMGSDARRRDKSVPSEPKADSARAVPPPLPTDAEDPSRFMPK